MRNAQLVDPGPQLVEILLALRTADDLPDLREQHVHGAYRLAVFVLLHVERLDLFRVVDQDNRLLEVALDQITFVLALQVEAPADRELELLAAFLEDFDPFGIVQPHEIVLDDETKSLEQFSVVHLGQKRQIVRAVFERVPD